MCELLAHRLNNFIFNKRKEIMREINWDKIAESLKAHDWATRTEKKNVGVLITLKRPTGLIETIKMDEKYKSLSDTQFELIQRLNAERGKSEVLSYQNLAETVTINYTAEEAEDHKKHAWDQYKKDLDEYIQSDGCERDFDAYYDNYIENQYMIYNYNKSKKSK